jgi:3-oxoacyl-[acyl-carrier protein] reductase
MSQKVILVTGASKGIGFATAQYLAKNKHHVLATARSADKLDELKNSSPRRLECVPCDLTDTTSIQRLTDYIREEQLVISALIHSAGGLINKPFGELTDSDWNSMWNLNVMSAVRLLRAVIPFFGKKSHIVTIGSMGGYQGSTKFPGLVAYSTSKGALSVWTECMAAELKNHDIAVNCLCLGSVQTEMFEMAFPGIKAPLQPEDMAEYISDFALKGHKFLNGKVLPVALGDP